MAARFLPQPRNLATVMGLQKAAYTPLHVGKEDKQRKRRVVTYTDYDTNLQSRKKVCVAQANSLSKSPSYLSSLHVAAQPHRHTQLHHQLSSTSSDFADHLATLMINDVTASELQEPEQQQQQQLAHVPINGVRSLSTTQLPVDYQTCLPDFLTETASDTITADMITAQPEQKTTIIPVSMDDVHVVPVPQLPPTEDTHILTRRQHERTPKITKGLKASSPPPANKKRKKRIQKSRAEPVRCNYPNEQEYKDAWEKWRQARDNNNASVHKSRALLRKQRADRAEAIKRKEEESRKLEVEAASLQRALLAMVKAVQDPDALSADEAQEIRSLMLGYEPTGADMTDGDINQAASLASLQLDQL